MSFYDALVNELNKMLAENEQNLPFANTEYLKGAYIAYHNCIIDVFNRLHITTDADYYEEDMLDD